MWLPSIRTRHFAPLAISAQVPNCKRGDGAIRYGRRIKRSAPLWFRGRHRTTTLMLPPPPPPPPPPDGLLMLPLLLKAAALARAEMSS